MAERINASVCHISFSPYPEDPRIRRYVNALLEYGYKVFVIGITDDINPKFEKIGNLEIHRINISKKRASYARRVFEYVMFFVRASAKASILYFKHKIKIFHTHNLPDFVVFTALIPKIFGAKLILDMHELTPEAMMMRENISEKSFVVKLSKFIEKISTKLADEHITIHDIAAKIFESRNKVKYFSIMNGVDANELQGLQKTHTDDFNIIYHGTINPNLNLGLVIDALSVLKTKLPPDEFRKVKFLLYGKGPSLTGLMEKRDELNLQDNVIYKGSLPHTEMLKELTKASVCIYPPLRNIYTEICYPIKLTELANLGIPVISSRYKTILHYYPEDTFFYFDAGDLKGLVKQILIVKNNPELASQRAENAKKAYDKVSWNKIMKPKYLQIINNLVKM
jgi:glycosyltransferase involved in cell wall biosynthesis